MCPRFHFLCFSICSFWLQFFFCGPPSPIVAPHLPSLACRTTQVFARWTSVVDGSSSSSLSTTGLLIVPVSGSVDGTFYLAVFFALGTGCFSLAFDGIIRFSLALTVGIMFLALVFLDRRNPSLLHLFLILDYQNPCQLQLILFHF